MATQRIRAHRALFLLSAGLILSLVCSNSYSAGSTPAPATSRSGAAIDYRLPRTDVAVAATYKFLGCTKEAGSDKEKITVAVDAELAAKPGADSRNLYHVDGSLLQSWRVKRSLGITVSDDGVLTGLNASNADQTPAIIGSGLKILAAVLPVLLAIQPEPRTCAQILPHIYPRAADALTLRDALRSQIQALNTALANTAMPPNVATQKVRQLNMLAKELVRVEDSLVVKTTAKIDLGTAAPGNDGATGTLELDVAPFAPWFADGITNDDLKQRVSRLLGLKFNSIKLAPTSTAAITFTGKPPRQKGTCKLQIFVPNMSRAQVSLLPEGEALGTTKPDEPIAKVEVPLAQWESPATVCLDAGFGESSTLGFKYDKFGRVTEFQWGSEATGANIAAAAAGAASDAVAIYKTMQGPSALDKAKAELDELDTQQKLNKLKACKAILDAGGFDCDTKPAQ